MNNVVSVKTKENVRKLRDIKIFTTEKKETIWCQNQIIQYLSAMQMDKTQILINKPVNVGPSILELSKILIYDFLYDYVKPKYVEKAKLCYRDRDID